MIIEILNENQGVISAIGLIFVVPLAILSDKVLYYFKRKSQRNKLKIFLIRELLINMDYVSSIEVSYLNNITDNNNLHLPHKSPRTNIIEKFMEPNLLESLSHSDQKRVIDIYSQLSTLKEEIYLWKRTLINNPFLIKDQGFYIGISSTSLYFINIVMQNMLQLWITLIKNQRVDSEFQGIKEISKSIRKKIHQGKWVRTCYKASEYKDVKYENIEKFDIILCWENDWVDAKKEVIEVKKIITDYIQDT